MPRDGCGSGRRRSVVIRLGLSNAGQDCEIHGRAHQGHADGGLTREQQPCEQDKGADEQEPIHGGRV